MTFEQKTVTKFGETIAKSPKIAIVAHTHPDGDAVGSITGAYHLIRHHFEGQQCPEITMMLPNKQPDFLNFLPGAELIVDGSAEEERCGKALMEADMIIAMDFNKGNRIEQLLPYLEQSKACKVLLDHHQEPDMELFDMVFSVPDLSSTCELAYWVFAQMWGKECLDHDSAKCLFTGICTDTGGFAYSCDDPSLYEASSKLVDLGIDAADINNHIDNTSNPQRMRFLGYCLCERLRVFEDLRFAYFFVSEEDLKKHNGTAEDLEIMVNHTLKMEQIEVGAMVKGVGGKVRLSFRSKYGFDVADFAKRHFDGGGHVKASGATSTMNFDDTVEYLERTMKAELEEYFKNSKK